jgi:hypothetical protein
MYNVLLVTNFTLLNADVVLLFAIKLYLIHKNCVFSRWFSVAFVSSDFQYAH